jgi:hypothetical protein
VDVLLAALAVVVTLVAAVRSTWSPCGQSMLSQINPIAEAGRGRRYGRTATWFVAGATVGGACLGAVCTLGAEIVERAGLSVTAALAIVSVAAVVAAVVDSQLLGFGPPFLRRQVNEDWLNRYRPWVYAGGFGWQIGVGFTTYVMTAAVPLAVVCAVCSATPLFALAIGIAFGFARGLTVLLSAPLRTQSALYDFHRRFSARGEAFRRRVIFVQLAVAVVAAWAAPAVVLAIFVTACAVAVTLWMSARALSSRTRRPITNRRLATDM